MAAAVLASTLVVRLGLQKQALERRVQDMASRSRDPYPGFLVPEVGVESVHGDLIALGGAAPGTLQLLFAFSTDCAPCLASVPAIKAIRAQAGPDLRVKVVGVSVDSSNATRRYVTEHSLDFPVVSLTQRRVLALYRLRRIPQVLLVDDLGRVKYVRFGSLKAATAIDSVRAAAQAGLTTAQAAKGGHRAQAQAPGVGVPNRL